MIRHLSLYPGRSRGRARAAAVRFGRHHLDLSLVRIACVLRGKCDLAGTASKHVFIGTRARSPGGTNPDCLVATLSPPVRVEPYALWHRTQELLEQPVPACVSAEAGRPWIALGAPLGMFLGFVAAFVNATDRARAHLLFKSIAVSAAAYAAYGMFAHILIRHLCSGPRSRCFHKRLGDLRE